MPRFVFVVVIGALLTSGLIVALNAFVTWALAGVTLGSKTLLIMYGVLMLVVGGAYAWTWSYMQQRYAATRGLLCTHCGYLVMGITSEQCPECGTRFSA